MGQERQNHAQDMHLSLLYQLILAKKAAGGIFQCNLTVHSFGSLLQSPQLHNGSK